MPSAHSATVSSLCVFSLLHFGPDTFQFAVTLFLSIIVCHDAMGVRHETGKQAVLINELIEGFQKMKVEHKLPAIELKEFVGHTPLQVVAGIALGVLDALFMYFVVFA
jgi:acid phosphatase family membrane protein YuiD